MAKEAKPEAAAETAGAPRKSKKLLIIVAAALVLILLIGGGAAYFLLKGNAAEEGEDGEVATEHAAAPAKKKDKDGKEMAPVYVALDQFTVNLAPADVRKTGPVYDLPLLLAVLAASLAPQGSAAGVAVSVGVLAALHGSSLAGAGRVLVVVSLIAGISLMRHLRGGQGQGCDHCHCRCHCVRSARQAGRSDRMGIRG